MCERVNQTPVKGDLLQKVVGSLLRSSGESCYERCIEWDLFLSRTQILLTGLGLVLRRSSMLDSPCDFVGTLFYTTTDWVHRWVREWLITFLLRRVQMVHLCRSRPLSSRGPPVGRKTTTTQRKPSPWTFDVSRRYVPFVVLLGWVNILPDLINSDFDLYQMVLVPFLK